MKTPVTIRSAKPGDGKDVLAMLGRLATHEGAANQPRLTLSALDAYVFCPLPRAYIYVAEQGATLLGFALVNETFSSWMGGTALHIGDLWVEPDARGQDVGRSLLEHALATFPNCRADVYVVRTNSARTFYERCGFAAQEDWLLYRRG